MPALEQHVVRYIERLLCHAAGHPIFDEVGPMVVSPAAPQVLSRRDGQRGLRGLWQLLQHARRSLFDPTHRAMEYFVPAVLRQRKGFLDGWDDISPVCEARDGLEC